MDNWQRQLTKLEASSPTKFQSGKRQREGEGGDENMGVGIREAGIQTRENLQLFDFPHFLYVILHKVSCAPEKSGVFSSNWGSNFAERKKFF